MSKNKKPPQEVKDHVSWKVEVQTDDSGNWYGNALRFPDEGQAQAYGQDLNRRWFAVRDTRVVQVQEPATDTFSPAGLGKL